jgi:hypothetical protein
VSVSARRRGKQRSDHPNVVAPGIGTRGQL